MAIKLPEATLTKEFEHILESDPALDTGRKGFADSMQKYKEGMGQPLLKDGEEPTRFFLKPIAGHKLQAALKDINARKGPYQWFLEIGAIALVRVENLIDPETGENIEIKRERGPDGYERLCKEQCDLLGVDILTELGSEVHNRSTPNPD